MDIDWLGAGGLVVGVFGAASGFLPFTNESLRRRYLKQLRKKTPHNFVYQAQKYVNANNIMDDKERVRKKDRYAERVIWYAKGLDLDRQMLANASSNEGFAVALCGMISREPKFGDAKFILKCAESYAPPHARYRQLYAIRAVASSGQLSAEEKGDLIGLAHKWSINHEHPDHLKAYAQETESQVRSCKVRH